MCVFVKWGRIVICTSMWLLSGTGNCFTCLTSSGQTRMFFRPSSYQEAAEGCCVISGYMVIKIKTVSKRLTWWTTSLLAQSSLWLDQHSHYEAVSSPMLTILKSHMPPSFARCLEQSARVFSSKEITCLVANWLNWRHSPQQKQRHKQEKRQSKRSSPSISNIFFYHVP